MGDSLKWAADRDEEEYFKSDDHKRRKKFADAWNQLAFQARTVKVDGLTIDDVEFLMKVESLDGESYAGRGRAKFDEDDLARLKLLVGPIVDRIASLAAPDSHWFRGEHDGRTAITACGKPLVRGTDLMFSTAPKPEAPWVTCEDCRKAKTKQ